MVEVHIKFSRLQQMRKRSPKQTYRFTIVLLWVLVIVGVIWALTVKQAPLTEPTLVPTKDADATQITNDAKAGKSLQGSTIDLGVDSNIQVPGQVKQ